MLCRLLEKLGPDDQPLTPGNPVAPYFGDQRRIPTIHMPYGQDVPITYAPAGVRRMTMLAYLLAWCFSEHQRACLQINQQLTSQIIVLIDEPETHLHPRWQRTVLPSLFQAINSWNNNSKAYQPVIQFIVATHAPLVMASMESIFDSTKDALWKMDLVDGDVAIERDLWRKRGDVNRWLRSDVFDLPEATSLEAQHALEEAAVLCQQDQPSLDEVKAVNEMLSKHLPDMDPFFIRWQRLMGDKLEAIA
jgi:hypothetical protein